MEKEKIEIIDAILKFMFSNGYEFNTNNNNESDLTPAFETKFFRSEFKSLVSENKLIRKFENSDCVFILTDEGKKASKIGISKYLDEIEQKEQLDIKSKTASVDSVRLSKLAIGVSVLAIIASFAVPFLVVNNEQHIKNPENINATSQQGQNETNKSQSVRLTDSALIENITHDTTFLNELKLKLKSNTTEKKITTP